MALRVLRSSYVVWKKTIHQTCTQYGFKPGRGKGDNGQSSLFNNERRWKDDYTFQALGSTDELSSFLGVCAENAKDENLEDVVELLTKLQSCLQDVMAHFATPPDAAGRELTKMDENMLKWVNAEIDKFGDQLPPLRQFILSGGGKTSASMQYARAVCRRAERTVVPLIRDEQVDSNALKFLNRTSDLLFVLGRYSCMKTQHDEVTYMRPTGMKEIRYDRQIRLWGDHGQSNIESSSVCVLGSSALASEILKNLVLAGVHKVCIIDDARVQMPDLGQNFFLTWDDVGKYRSERVAESLKVCLKIKGVALASLELRAELEQTELNPSVSCEYRVFSQKELGDEKTLRYLCGFSVVVAANTKIHEGDYVSDIAESLYSYGIPFVYARVCGLLGTIRISVKEHFIFDNHEENPKPDLRLDKPFSTLQQLVSNTPDTVTMSTEELKHTPYLLLYFKALKIYRDELQNPNCFPSTYAGRKHFLECLWKLRRPDDNDSENFDQAKAAVLRSVQLTTIPTVVRDILNDRKCLDIENPQSFWLLCYGLKLFVEKHGVLPLSGTLPDMASDTLSYTKLAKLYHDKSHQDAMEVLAFIREEETRRNVSVTISEQECVHFCKKSSQIRLQRGTSLCRFKELKPLLADILLLEDDANPTPSVWLLLLFASLRFGLQKLRFPGECQNMPLNSDLDGLKQRLTWMIEENEGDVEDVMKKISENSLKEILRFSNSEPHVISSLIGGITAQEVIKLATNQYVPLDTTFVYDGCSQTSATFKL